MENKQFRFSEEATEVLSTNIFAASVKIEDFIGEVGRLDITESVVKILDQNAEDWGVTENLFVYFANELINSGDDEIEDTAFIKPIIEQLYKKYCEKSS